MSTSRISTATGLSTAVLAWLAFFGIANWSQVEARLETRTPPRDPHELAARLATDLAADFDAICGNAKFRELHAHSPCATRDITAEQLDDPAHVGAAATLVRAQSDALSEAIRRAERAVARAREPSSEAAIGLWMQWDRDRTRTTRALLATNPTWGEWNRERVRSVALLRSALDR